MHVILCHGILCPDMSYVCHDYIRACLVEILTNISSVINEIAVLHKISTQDTQTTIAQGKHTSHTANTHTFHG